MNVMKGDLENADRVVRLKRVNEARYINEISALKKVSHTPIYKSIPKFSTIGININFDLHPPTHIPYISQLHLQYLTYVNIDVRLT